MVLSSLAAKFYIINGIAILVLSAAAFFCGIAAWMKTSFTEGLLAFNLVYFIAPGVMSIVAGWKQGRAVLGGTLATNIMGTVQAIGVVIGFAVLWHLQKDLCVKNYYYRSYEQSCFPPLIGTLTILSALLVILCFAGSVYGCVSTCTTGEPLQASYTLVPTVPAPVNSVIVNTSASHVMQQPPQYSQHAAAQGWENFDHASSSDALLPQDVKLVNV